MTETYTYPDGSQRIGVAPFPKTSPLQDASAVPVDQTRTVALTAHDLDGSLNKAKPKGK